IISDKSNELEQLELDLHLIIKLKRKSALALYALGYTLAHRSVRLEEARQLIDQARELDPSDAAITDSLGWVYYRLGDLVSAERLLREAFASFPDAEVAAHLGEVLWQQNKRAEARKIWNKAFKAQPNDTVLIETIQRLTDKEP